MAVTRRMLAAGADLTQIEHIFIDNIFYFSRLNNSAKKFTTSDWTASFLMIFAVSAIQSELSPGKSGFKILKLLLNNMFYGFTNRSTA